MADNEEKKNIFGKVLDGLSSRDEKEALEKAQQELEAARKQAAQAQAASQRIAAQKDAATRQALADAQKLAAEAEAKAKELEAQLAKLQEAEKSRAMEEKLREFKEKQAAEREAVLGAAREQAAPALITEHTLSSDETLSHLALKYYGHATPPYWRFIYEANKELIGDNPNRVRRGMVIKIPVLPPDFKG
jgi:nucleoid-associated protein YgaU